MQLVEFDFSKKEERSISLDELSSSPGDGVFYWMVIGSGEEAEGRRALELLGANPEGARALIGPQQEARYDLYDDAIHFSVSEAWLDNGSLQYDVIEFLLGKHYLAVMTPGFSPAIEGIKRVYRDDFFKFARSSGFLLYELSSQLFESYRRTYHNFTSEVERVQLTLFGEVSDEIFVSVSKLTTDILGFRRMVLASRDLFKALSSRRSAFVSETTQPSLNQLADRMERLGMDLDGERTILNETLNLYMGMVSHRTNRIINRLTIFSMIFLPLSFLCGVYGMNFEVMPELEWAYSYPVFWVVVVLFMVTFFTIVKKKKWI